MCCKCCSFNQRRIWLIAFGVICFIIGILLITLWPATTESLVKSILPLRPGSWIFNVWLNPPLKAYLYVYLFNWTNVNEATNHTIKPNFEQVGPYVFREIKSKEDITWHDNDTMTYFNRRTWFFEENMSKSSLENLITLPHPPSVVMAKEARNMDRYIKKIINYALNTEGGSLYVQKTADEWLFKGFYDPLTEFASLLLSELVQLQLDKFHFFLGRNASKTYEGSYTIHTGQTNLRIMGEVEKWQGSNQSPAFSGECGHINGSTGDIFAPGRDPDETVSIFIPDYCRSINMFPDQHKTIFRGVETLRYSTNNMSFDSGQLYPNMECYCSEKSEKCPPNGAIDVGPCLFGAPMYVSLPHFLNADPSYTDTITGMKPNKEEHEFYIIIEPQLGIPITAQVNMQINMLIQDDNDFEMFKDVNEFYAPLIILSERGDLNDEWTNYLRILFTVPAIGVGIGIALTAIGIILLSVAIYMTIKRMRGNEKTKLIKDTS